jgi:Raf kinase inhibitor-like YbhB/YbcL family protein
VGAGRALIAALAVAALAGCGGDDEQEAAPDIPKTIELSTPAFKDGGAIPTALTCDGAGTPPTIAWRAATAGAVELVFVVEDPDADDTFTHWTAYGLTAATGSGLAPDGRFPTGVKEGRNSAGEDGWTPPCPPEGDDPHRYVFSMYALPKASGLEAGADPEAVEAAAETATAYGRFTGTYKR